MVDYGVFNILTPSNDILIVSYDLPEWNKVLRKKSKKIFFQGSPLCIFLKILKIFENVPRVPPSHIFRNFELLELVIVVVVVVEGEGEGGGEGGGGGGGVEGEVGGGGGGGVGGVGGGGGGGGDVVIVVVVEGEGEGEGDEGGEGDALKYGCTYCEKVFSCFKVWLCALVKKYS